MIFKFSTSLWQSWGCWYHTKSSEYSISMGCIDVLLDERVHPGHLIEWVFLFPNISRTCGVLKADSKIWQIRKHSPSSVSVCPLVCFQENPSASEVGVKGRASISEVLHLHLSINGQACGDNNSNHDTKPTQSFLTMQLSPPVVSSQSKDVRKSRKTTDLNFIYET